MQRPLAALATEQSDPRYSRIDTLHTVEIVQLMNVADAAVPAAVGRAAPAIAAAIDAIAARVAAGGRLLYVGAGTSGRLAVLDAAECPPTFGTDPELVQAIIAGGEAALVRSVEGAEDDAEAGAAAIRDRATGRADCVVGISASGRAPYVLAAVREARRRGALTVALACNTGTPLAAVADHAIEVVVGPEVLAGSTRLKAGTAQKLVLNMISTITMIRCGRTYQNYMVDVVASNAKLLDRAARIVADITGAGLPAAREALEQAGRHVKTAVVMIDRGIGAEHARELLAAHGNRLGAALGDGGRSDG